MDCVGIQWKTPVKLFLKDTFNTINIVADFFTIFCLRSKEISEWLNVN